MAERAVSRNLRLIENTSPCSSAGGDRSSPWTPLYAAPPELVDPDAARFLVCRRRQQQAYRHDRTISRMTTPTTPPTMAPTFGAPDDVVTSASCVLAASVSTIVLVTVPALPRETTVVVCTEPGGIESVEVSATGSGVSVGREAVVCSWLDVEACAAPRELLVLSPA